MRSRKKGVYEFFTFDLCDDPSVGAIKRLDGVPKSYLLNRGVSIKEIFPVDCELSFHSSEGDRLTDLVCNIASIVIVSSAAKVVFEKCGATDEYVEYLPFILKNKKGKAVSETPYYIANNLRKIECVDFDRIKQAAEEDDEEDNPETAYYSGIYYEDNKKKVINEFAYLYLGEDKLPDDAVFFRIGECPQYMVIRSDLVEAIREAAITGICLKEMGGHGLVRSMFPPIDKIAL